MWCAPRCSLYRRFRNFNIVHPDVAEAKDSYKELADRLLELGTAPVAARLQAVIDALP